MLVRLTKDKVYLQSISRYVGDVQHRKHAYDKNNVVHYYGQGNANQKNKVPVHHVLLLLYLRGTTLEHNTDV